MAKSLILCGPNFNPNPNFKEMFGILILLGARGLQADWAVAVSVSGIPLWGFL